MTLKILNRILAGRSERFLENFWTIIGGCFIVFIWSQFLGSNSRTCSSGGRSVLETMSDTWYSSNSILDQFGWMSKRPYKRVLLVTYMRSGSTFTGGILASHPDAFYIFEPLHSLHRYKMNSRRFRSSRFILDNSREIDDITSSDEASQQILESYLNCNFVNLDLKTLQDRFPFLYNSNAPYSSCLKQAPGGMGVVQCLHILYTQCSMAKVSIIKTIRTPMSLVKRMLKRDKTLQIIYLVRDPRAITLSRLHLKRNKPQARAYNKTAAKLCSNMHDDVNTFRKLKQQYPNNLFALKYEDLAAKTLNVSKKLFEVLDIDFKSEVQQFIEKVSHSDIDTKCITCIERKNSTMTSQRWRTEIKYEGALDVEKTCKDVMSVLGYLPLKDEGTLTNMSVDLNAKNNLDSVFLSIAKH